MKSDRDIVDLLESRGATLAMLADIDKGKLGGGRDGTLFSLCVCLFYYVNVYLT